MEIRFNDYIISDDKSRIQLDRVCALLSGTYWAKSRPREVIARSIDNSLCFGVYKDGVMIGFARCVTDYAVMYNLCDVVIDGAYRGRGIGKALVGAVTRHELLSGLLGQLGTRDAHRFYEQFGFQRDGGNAMLRFPGPG